MRFAVFSELYTPSVGGQEMFFRGLSEALLARGHQVDVYCIGHEDGLPATELLAGVSTNRHPISSKYMRPSRNAPRNWVQIVGFALHIRKIALTRKYDAYLLNQWPLLHVLSLPRSAAKSALLHWCEVRHSLFYRTAQAILPRLVRFNGAISDSVARQIGEVSGREVITLPSGLDLSRAVVRPRADRSGIVALGRITAHKNLPMLVEVYEIVRRGGYTGRLTIAGDGPAMPELKARAEASPFASDIYLLGFITDDQKFELLASSEVLAMPSTREGFPHVVSESMCCGLPIVTSNYPENGTKDVVAHFDAGVVADEGPKAFAAGIGDALTDWDRYSENGLARAQSLDWSFVAERLERQFAGLAADR